MSTTPRKTPARKVAAPRKAPARRTANETKPKAQIVENNLHYRTLDGEEIVISLNIKLPILEELMQIEEKIDTDPRVMFGLLGKVIGRDVDKVGMLDVADLFGEWSDALGKTFGQARLGNSASSSN